MMACRDICRRLPRATRAGYSAEPDGRRCAKCDAYFFWDGVTCPCCGARLRQKARTAIARRYRRRKAACVAEAVGVGDSSAAV